MDLEDRSGKDACLMPVTQLQAMSSAHEEAMQGTHGKIGIGDIFVSKTDSKKSC